MMFLTPWPAVLAAGAGVPLLVLMYVLRLRRRPLRVSSTVLWEQAVKDLAVNEPFRRFAPGLIFLLQLLAVLAIAAALGRPALRSPTDPILGSADRIVIVLDVSASMRVSVGDPAKSDSEPSAGSVVTCLDLAKREAVAIVERIERSGGERSALRPGGFTTGTSGDGEGDRRPQAMIVAAGREARALTGFTADTRELRDAIDAIQPTDEPLFADAASELVRAAFTDSTRSESATGNHRGAPLAVFITDGTRPVSTDARWSLITVGPPRAGTPSPPDGNLGIVALSLRRESSDPSTVRVSVRVVSTAPHPVETTVVCRLGRLSSDEAADSAALAQVPEASTERDVVRGLPITLSAASTDSGFAEITAEFAVPVPGFAGPGPTLDGRVLATVELLHKDRFDADNRASAVVDNLRPPNILLVAPAGRSDPFLLSALEATEPASLRIVDAATYSALTGSDNGSSSGWASVDAIVFDRITPESATPKSTPVPTRPTLSFAGSLPPHFTLAGPTPVDVARPTGSRSRVLSWSRSHAVLRDVRLDTTVIFPAIGLRIPKQEDRTRLEDGRVCTAEALALGTAPSDGGDGPSGPSAVLIAAVECASEIPWGIAQSNSFRNPYGPSRTRHVLVGFALDRSNWGPGESFPIFIANSIEWLTAASPIGFSGAGRFLTTSMPGGPNRIGMDPASGLPVNLLDIEESTGSPLRPGASVGPANHPSNRVEVASGSDPATDKFQIPVAEPGTTSRTMSPRGIGRELWPLFVLAAALLLTVEWIVYAWRSRA